MKQVALLFGILVMTGFGAAEAFANGPTLRRRRPSALWQASDDDDDDSKNHNNDIDRARQQLESLLGPLSSDLLDDPKVDLEALMDPDNADGIDELLPPPPPLTTAERDRRLVEIQLLRRLQDSDEPLQELWDLWFAERGPTARKRLEQADAYMARGQVVAAEAMLRKMIEEYGVYWVEPLNRLATLLYLDGRLEESYQLCLVVLRLRPYHFGALSGIVAVSTALRGRDQARRWAEKRLPSLVASSSFPPFATNGPTNPRRREWVQRAVKVAQETLAHLEYQTQKGLGKPEKYYKKRANRRPANEETLSSLLDTEEDAWQ